MKKKILSAFAILVSTCTFASKEVEFVNLTGTDLVIRMITTHDYYGFATGVMNGPVHLGYDIGQTSNYNYNSNVIIVPNGQTVDLYDYTRGTYDANYNFMNTGVFPFGWHSVLNPFYGRVFNYSNVNGVDTPYGSPITLPSPNGSHTNCIKNISISVIGYTPTGENFEVHLELNHKSSDNHTVPAFDQHGYMYYTKYEHRPLTNGMDSDCARDRITIGSV